MARTIPSGLSGIVEQLELDRPQLVSMADIERMAEQTGVATPANLLALRLREHGWLIPTSVRGVWEFAPAELAGPYSSADPLMVVKAFAISQPRYVPVLAGQAAAWTLGMADRVPSVIEVAFDKLPAVKIPDSISASSYSPLLATIEAKEVEVLCPESIIVHMTQRPSVVYSWQSAVEWLPEVAAECTRDRMMAELAGRTPSVYARTGYLLQGMRPDIAEAIFAASKLKSKVHFGSGTAKRNDEHWMVSDAVLPFDPRKMETCVDHGDVSRGLFL